jgi:hypothetical protein
MLLCYICENEIDDVGLPEEFQGRYVVRKYPTEVHLTCLSCCLSNLEETVDSSKKDAEDFLELTK